MSSKAYFVILREHLWLGGVGTSSPGGLPNAGSRRRLGCSDVAVVGRLRSARRSMRMGVLASAAVESLAVRRGSLRWWARCRRSGLGLGSLRDRKPVDWKTGEIE